MVLPPQILKKLVIQTGLISEEDFDNALKEAQRSEKSVVNILISRGLLTQDYYADILAGYFHVPRIKLIGRQIPREILDILPETIARSHNAIVFDKKDNTIHVALLDPADLENLDFLEKYTGHFVKAYFQSVFGIRR